jgi:hypothetical protein
VSTRHAAPADMQGWLDHLLDRPEIGQIFVHEVFNENFSCFQRMRNLMRMKIEISCVNLETVISVYPAVRYTSKYR